jgi:hypothetical protein
MAKKKLSVPFSKIIIHFARRSEEYTQLGNMSFGLNPVTFN